MIRDGGLGCTRSAGAIVKRAAADRLDRLMQWSAAQMMYLIQRAVEQAFRLACRYCYRHSPKNVGTDAGVAT